MTKRARKVTPADAMTALMKARRWNQSEVAAFFGVTQSTVSRWMNGDRMVRHRQARLWMLEHGVAPECL